MASAGKLTALQVRILGTLAGLTPRWTLSGGGALAGVHTQHRTTRDLDLFYQARRALEHAPEDAKARLRGRGLGVAVQQRAEAFCRLEVRDAGGDDPRRSRSGSRPARGASGGEWTWGERESGSTRLTKFW